MNILLAHGFNVSDSGKRTTGRLVPYLSSLGDVQRANYGWLGLLGVRFFNQTIAKTIHGMVLHPTVGIGHSNGCDVLLRAARLGTPFTRLILVNPALDVDTEFPEQIERIDVFYNADDVPVFLAQFLLFHHWGAMGRYGYQGSDPRVFNHDETELFNARGHSAVFAISKIKQFSNYIARALTWNCGQCGGFPGNGYEQT